MTKFIKSLSKLTSSVAILVSFLAFSQSSFAQCNAGFQYVSSGNTVAFYDSSYAQGTIVSSTWDFGDGSPIISGTNATHTYLNGLYYYVCHTITTVNPQCSDTQCDTVYLGNSFLCQATMNVVPDSSGNGITFYGNTNPPGQGLSFVWNFGDNTSPSTLQNPHHVYSQPGTYVACVTVTTTNGCVDSLCSVITVGFSQPCNANFYWSNTGNNQISFTNTSSGGVNYYWSFGDSTSSTLQSPQHTYSSPGTYYVCLYISDSLNGCFDVQCYTVSVTGINNGCNAAFNYTYLNGFGLLQFTDMSTSSDSITNWYWSFGDGNYSTQTNPSHQYNSGGPYTVCLVIVTPTCSDSACISIYVQMGTGCQATMNYTPDSSGNGIQFYGNTNPPGQGVSWYWSFGDSTFSTLQNPHHLYANSGTYTVCLVVTTVSGCVDSLCTVITVGFSLPCNAYFTYSQNSLNPVITFTNQSTGGSSYYWTFGDKTFSTAMNPVHTYLSAGNYYVCLTITNLLGTCTSTYCDSVYVSAQLPCVSNFSYWNDTTQFGAWFTDLSTTSDSIISWYWSFGDSTYSTLQNPYHPYANAGQYQVCLIITTANGCVSTSCQLIIVTGNNPCIPIFSWYQNLNFFNDTVYFTLLNNCPGLLSVTWYFGDSTTATGTNPSHVFSNTGWYIVCIDIVTVNGTYQWCDSVYAFRFGSTALNSMDVLNNVEVFPNPLNNSGTLQLQMIKESVVAVDLYSLVGEKIKSYFNNHLTSGKHTYSLDVTGINNGMYLLRITTGKQVIAKKISVNH